MSAMLTLLVIAGAARGGSSGRPALNALARSSRKVPFADMNNARGSFTGSVTADNAASESLIEEALCDSVREPLARFSGFLDHGDGRHPIEILGFEASNVLGTRKTQCGDFARPERPGI